MKSKKALGLLVSRVQVGAYKEEMQKCFDIVNEAINKLEKRDTPMEVIKETKKRYVDTYDYYEVDYYKCPCCEKMVLYDRFQITLHTKNNHCQHCGQRLDWDNENDK